MKILIIICLFISNLIAQEIKFSNGSVIKMEELKKKFKIHEVDVFNYHIRQVETYQAFDFKEILNNVYGIKWRENTYVNFKTLDSYEPYVETYKFKERKPYLAFAKKFSKGFNTIHDGQKILELAPFYLIWLEDYKGKAAKRKNHWPYRISEVGLTKYTPLKIMPGLDAEKDIFWGYKNYVKQCIACHAIDGFGGKKGESVISESILSKDNKTLYRYISNPQNMDQKSQMPPFPMKIGKRKIRIKNIVKYMRYISKRDFKNFGKTKKKEQLRKTELSELIDIIDELP